MFDWIARKMTGEPNLKHLPMPARPGGVVFLTEDGQRINVRPSYLGARETDEGIIHDWVVLLPEGSRGELGVATFPGKTSLTVAFYNTEGGGTDGSL